MPTTNPPNTPHNTPPPNSKSRLIDAALLLLQQYGYSGMSIGDVLKNSQVSRGSLYFHFPDGKDGLVIAALEQFTTQFCGFLQNALDDTLQKTSLSEESLGDAIKMITQLLALYLDNTQFHHGCPVMAVATEDITDDPDTHSPTKQQLVSTVQRALSSWIKIITNVLQKFGFADHDAAQCAAFILSSVEGAMIVAKAQQKTDVLLQTGIFLADFLAMRMRMQEFPKIAT